jgi:hypothetical protein
MKKAFVSIVLLGLVVLCNGCAEVQPWEKGDLARSSMRFDGDRLAAKFGDHIYTSRENASGGAGVGGGGCGCN